MAEFVFKINKADADTLSAVRCVEGLQAAGDDAFIWMKGIAGLPEQNNKLKQLPVQHTFFVDEKNNLFKKDTLTPVDTLHPMSWQPLTSFIKIELPASAMPGKAGERIKIKIAPSAVAKEGNALLVPLSAWKNYADAAPAARLHLLQFAVSAKNEALITGHPLPALPGKEYWITNDILLPCGYDFEIPLMPVFISEHLNKDKNAFILFDAEGNWQRIEKVFLSPPKEVR